MGVAAMLKNQWPDAGFRFASLSDRKPVSEDDDLIVLAAPDPQGWSLTLAMSSQVAKCKAGHTVALHCRPPGRLGAHTTNLKNQV